jgi:hypothetical protein
MTVQEHHIACVALLESLEWRDHGDPDHHNSLNDNCIVCYGQRRNGHHKHCELEALLNYEI